MRTASRVCWFFLTVGGFLTLEAAEEITLQRTCPHGHFQLSHDRCKPCKSCHKSKVIAPCSPTQDTVCGHDLQTRVFHYPCDGRDLGIFVEHKLSALQHLMKKRVKGQKVVCGVLKRYKKRIFDSRWHMDHRCPVGQYLWSAEKKSENDTDVSLDCRPCSECLPGTEIMSPCKDMQDSFCSFPRVNNSMEIFLISCADQGPTLHIYSTRLPSVSSSRLHVIKVKLQSSLCRRIRKYGTFHAKSLGSSAGILQSGGGEHRGETRKQNNVDDASSRNLDKQLLKYKKKTSKAKRCRRKNYKPKACKALRDKRRRRKQNNFPVAAKIGQVFNSSWATTTVPGISIKASATSTTYSRVTLRPTTRVTKRLLLKAAAAFSSGIPKSTDSSLTTSVMKQSFNASVTSDFTNDTQHPIPYGGGIGLEEDDPHSDSYNQGSAHVLALPSVVIGSVVTLSLIIALLLFVRQRRSQKKKNRECDPGHIRESDIDSSSTECHVSSTECHVSSAECHAQDSLTHVNSENIPTDPEAKILKIVDPLRRHRRPKSQDSGYMTSKSLASSQGSRPSCKEIESISDLMVPLKLDIQHVRSVSVSENTTNCVAPVTENCSLSRSECPLPYCHIETSERRRFRSLSTFGEFSPVDSVTECSLSTVSQASESVQLFPSSAETQSVFDSCVFINNLEDLPTAQNDHYTPGSSVNRDSSKTNPHYNSLSSVSSLCCEISVDIEQSYLHFPDSRSLHSLDSPLATSAQAMFSKQLEKDLHQVVRNKSPSSCSEKSLFYDTDGSSQTSKAETLSSKSRNPSGDSSASSVSMHIKIPLDWLHKETITEPGNFLPTYHSSVTTQTDDWHKTNLKSQPMFCPSWQDFRSFSQAGGQWSLQGSDVRLEIPRNAVPPGHSADIAGATYTNLSLLRQTLKLTDKEVMVGPLAEFNAGPKFLFQKHISLFLPHCLPPGIPEEQIKLYHIDKTQDGEFIVKTLPSKEQYKLNQQSTKTTSKQSMQPLNVDAEAEDIGFFQFLSTGELLISTRQFCGYLCTICRNVQPKPQIHMVATAKQFKKPVRAGDLCQVGISLYLWDRKIMIQDFRRDYLQHKQVGEQTLHVMEEYENSVVKIEFSLYDEEDQPQWRHALRPGKTDPIFAIDKPLFPLRELLCCHAKDSPRCEEWLTENLVKPGDVCNDFQCFIDVENMADPASSPTDDSDRRLQPKKATLFIGDIKNSIRLDVPKDVADNSGANNNMWITAPQPCACHHQASHIHPKIESNTPYGHLEQGSPLLHNAHGCQRLSEEHRLHPISLKAFRMSDPSPVFDEWTTDPTAPADDGLSKTWPKRTGHSHKHGTALETGAGGQLLETANWLPLTLSSGFENRAYPERPVQGLKYPLSERPQPLTMMESNNAKGRRIHEQGQMDFHGRNLNAAGAQWVGEGARPKTTQMRAHCQSPQHSTPEAFQGTQSVFEAEPGNRLAALQETQKVNGSSINVHSLSS